MYSTWSWQVRTQRRHDYSTEITYRRFGEKGSGFRRRGDVQDFNKLRDQCLAEGCLFEDPAFEAIDTNVFYTQKLAHKFEWKRPIDLVPDPHLFVEGASRFDVIQGQLGDCWLLAAVANLTLNPTIFHTVVPEDQGFMSSKKYAGIFHFRFWQYGKWIDVVVDDRLPTFGGQLLFLQSAEKNEFWSALLEKAYAKLHGSYEALKGGKMAEAMSDFTGGLCESFQLDQAPPNLFAILQKAFERNSLMGCSIPPDPKITEMQLPNGLVRGHAYSITAVKMVDIKTARVSGKIPLLRIRNPWGNEAEWNGAWSDKSREWQFIPPDQKEELGLVFDSDGEFWMSFADFMKNFHELEICNLSPDALELEADEHSDHKVWVTKSFDGSWTKGVTAGGCRNHIETFASNPQYRIVLEDPDEDDDENFCTVIVSLMQKNHRAQRRMGVDILTIGYVIYHLKNPDAAPKPLPRRYFEYNSSIAKVEHFTNKREVCQRFKLAPGTYCIVPSTFDPNEEGDFLLRVFSEKKNDMNENDENLSVGDVDQTIVDEVKQTDRSAVIKDCFKKIAGEDMEVDGNELKEVLDFVLKKEFDFDGFGINVCRGMVAMMDSDRSGKLGFEEFKELWFNIATWKAIFKRHDKENTGTLSTFELREALASAGYHLNWRVLKVLTLRYANKNNTVSFEDFILCAVKLKNMIEAFKERDPNNTNRAVITMDDWITLTMYA